jgi:hypothetical protein
LAAKQISITPLIEKIYNLSDGVFGSSTRWQAGRAENIIAAVSFAALQSCCNAAWLERIAK